MVCRDLFSKPVVTTGVKVACLLQGLQALIVLALGIDLILSYHTQLALGSQIKSAGGALIFLAWLYPIPAIAGYYGAKHHNKFLLLVHIVGLGGIVALHFIIGGAIYGMAVPTFSYEFQNYCLVNSHVQNNATAAKCKAYFNSDDYAGLSLAWQIYYNESLNDNTAASGLIQIQQVNFCCGLGPPANCFSNLNTFPNKFPAPADIPQTICVAFRTMNQYYPPTPLCYHNNACPYDHPIGSCGVTDVAPGSIGCAGAFHDYIASPVLTIGSCILTAVIFLIIFICAAIVLMFKRKEEDILPPLGFGHWRSSAKVYLASDVRKLDALNI